MNKFLLSLGSATTVITPIAAVVACGNSSSKFLSYETEYKDFLGTLPKIHNAKWTKDLLNKAKSFGAKKIYKKEEGNNIMFRLMDGTPGGSHETFTLTGDKTTSKITSAKLVETTADGSETSYEVTIAGSNITSVTKSDVYKDSTIKSDVADAVHIFEELLSGLTK